MEPKGKRTDTWNLRSMSESNRGQEAWGLRKKYVRYCTAPKGVVYAPLETILHA